MAYKVSSFFYISFTKLAHVVSEGCGMNDYYFENTFAKANKFSTQMFGKTSRMYIL